MTEVIYEMDLLTAFQVTPAAVHMNNVNDNNNMIMNNNDNNINEDGRR